MSATMTASRSTVKATTVIFTPANTRRLRNPTFGQGVFVQNDRKLPVRPNDADLAWAARELNATTAADASDDVWADEFERRTMSVLEYQTARLDAAAAMLDRYLSAEEQEMAEWGCKPVAPEDMPVSQPEPTPVVVKTQPSRMESADGTPPPVATDDRSVAEINADFEHAERQAAIEANAALPCGDFLPDDDFTPPAEVDAIEWSTAILGELRTVAPAEAITYARQLHDDIDTVPGRMVRPMFDSLDTMRAKLVTRKPKDLTLHQISRAKRLAVK